MTRTRLTTVDSVPENGSYLFTVRERDGRREEVILVRCDAADASDAGAVDDTDGDQPVEAWRNFCQHETDQRLDRGFGAAVRDGEVVCPKHGSMFDTCTGYCDNGKAADSYLSGVDVAVEDGVVYLTDDTVDFRHDGGIEDDGDGDDGPSSTSHLTF
jgi:nitrite reductase/ring-hydroxylating ferredoxin subunit